MRSDAHERTSQTELPDRRRRDCVDGSCRAVRIHRVNRQRICRNVGRVWRVRVDRAGISWVVQYVDHDIRAKSRASGEVNRNPGGRSRADPDSVPRGIRHRRANALALRIAFLPVLAFLAALVSALVFFVLLRRNGAVGAPCESWLGGHQADCLRPLAYRGESIAVAGAVRTSCPHRVHAVRVFHLLCLSADSRWHSVLQARFRQLLGGDDVFCRRLRAWLRDSHAFPGAEPMVHAGGPVARRTRRRPVHRAD